MDVISDQWRSNSRNNTGTSFMEYQIYQHIKTIISLEKTHGCNMKQFVSIEDILKNNNTLMDHRDISRKDNILRIITTKEQNPI